MRETGWQAIGRVAKKRRERMRLNQEELHLFGGPKVATVGKFERAAQPSFPTRTQKQMEDALGWLPGTIEKAITEHKLVGRIPSEDDLVEKDLPDRERSIAYYRSVAAEVDVDGLGSELDKQVNALRVIIEMVPEDYRDEAVQAAVDGILEVRRTIEPQELDEFRRRRATERRAGVSEPAVRTDDEVAAHDEDVPISREVAESDLP